MWIIECEEDEYSSTEGIYSSVEKAFALTPELDWKESPDGSYSAGDYTLKEIEVDAPRTFTRDFIWVVMRRSRSGDSLYGIYADDAALFHNLPCMKRGAKKTDTMRSGTGTHFGFHAWKTLLNEVVSLATSENDPKLLEE